MNTMKRKTWTVIKSDDSWALFKIMSEFVEGYESLRRIGPCVASLDRQERTLLSRNTFKRRQISLRN